MTKTIPLLFTGKYSLFLIASLLLTTTSFALTAPVEMPAEASHSTKMTNALSKMSTEEFLNLTPKRYKELTGEKLSFSQKISLKLTQSKMKKAIKEHKEVKRDMQAAPFDTYDFNLGGFILGLILPALGVLIAYLIGDPTVIKWAWVGFGIFFVIFLLILIF